MAARPWWDVARDTARDPMLWFLIGTGALYLLIGERVEAATVVAGIAPLLGMDAFLHRRTRASTDRGAHRGAAAAAALVVAPVAAWWPARRATRLSPVRALASE